MNKVFSKSIIAIRQLCYLFSNVILHWEIQNRRLNLEFLEPFNNTKYIARILRGYGGCDDKYLFVAVEGAVFMEVDGEFQWVLKWGYTDGIEVEHAF